MLAYGWPAQVLAMHEAPVIFEAAVHCNLQQ